MRPPELRPAQAASLVGIPRLQRKLMHRVVATGMTFAGIEVPPWATVGRSFVRVVAGVGGRRGRARRRREQRRFFAALQRADGLLGLATHGRTA